MLKEKKSSVKSWVVTGFVLYCCAVVIPAQAVTVRNSDMLSIDYAERFVTGRDYSTINVWDGADISSLRARDFSTVNMAGGDVNRLVTSGDSNAYVTGGTINTISSWSDSNVSVSNAQVGKVWVLGDSTVSLSNLLGLDQLYVSGDSRVTINALDFAYEGDLLRGTWLNGTSFAIETSGRLAINNISVNTSVVPIPAASWLFMSSIVGLGLVGRQRQLGKAGKA